MVLMKPFAGKEWTYRCREWSCRHSGGGKQISFSSLVRLNHREEAFIIISVANSEIYSRYHSYTFIIYFYLPITLRQVIIIHTLQVRQRSNSEVKHLVQVLHLVRNRIKVWTQVAWLHSVCLNTVHCVRDRTPILINPQNSWQIFKEQAEVERLNM